MSLNTNAKSSSSTSQDWVDTFEDPISQESSLAWSSSSQPSTVTPASSVSQLSEPELTSLPPAVPEAKRDRIISAALKWIIMDMLPLTTLDSSAFREFLAHVNPLVRLPSAATIRGELVMLRV
ncbi:hypothetical protein BG011_009017 [Mortierella polycephala]|uniref:Uncharacterized protein n=1 Tax=Mortierella polycephala TaxID=41804 RepID=A0A9P6U7R6_9FUNG|nr:hypothetical protein BG011_009017 [Mortierella polycephala]